MCSFIQADEPNLLRHVFPAYRVPRVSFAEEGLTVRVPRQIWCVDATFSVGSLALRPPQIDQVLELQQHLERLGKHSGIVRSMEIRIDGPASRELLAGAIDYYRGDRNRVEPVAAIGDRPECCEPLGGLGLREAGIPVGVSDFLRSMHDNALASLLATMDACLERQIQPRVDLLDVTRADVEGVVLPLLTACLEHLVKQGQGRLKVRLCDSLGLGLPWPEVPVPRSIPRVVHVIRDAFGLQPDQLEIVASNDMGLALANTIAAVVYGCGGAVTSAGGIGERSGIAPTEAVLLHLDGLFGVDCDYGAVQALHRLVEELGHRLPQRYPVWGDRALTSSQIHLAASADELVERYAPFDTQRVLSRAPQLLIRRSSGPSGLVQLIRRYLPHVEVQPEDEVVRSLMQWIHEHGIDTVHWEAIEPRLRELSPELFEQTEGTAKEDAVAVDD